MINKFIPRINTIQQTSVIHAKANDSDPFAFGRMKLELKHKCCSQGEESDVREDAEKIMKIREENRTIDHEAIAQLKKRLGI